MLTTRIRIVIFYAVPTVLLALILTKQLDVILPDKLATQIGHNSEAFAMILMTCALIQFVRPGPDHARPRTVALCLIGCGLLLGALLLHWSDLDSTYRTHIESLAGAGLLALYLAIRRPIRFAPFLALGLFVFMVAANQTDFVTLQAETLCFALLAIISLDIADRSILDPSAPDRPGYRLAWCAVLLLAPVVVYLLTRADLTGTPYDIVRYARRAHEPFISLLVMHLYFAYWLPFSKSGRLATTRSRAGASPA